VQPEGVEPQQVQSELGRVFPTAVSNPASISASIRPVLAPAGTELSLSGSLARGGVARDPTDGLWLETAAGQIRLAPVADNLSPAQLVAGSAAVLFEGEAGMDMLVRASPAGFTIYMQQAQERARVGFALVLPDGARFQLLPKGNVGILVRDPRAVPSPSLPKGEGVSATISEPVVLDSRGRRVRAAFDVDGKRVRLDLHPDEAPPFPVVARLDWIPSGDLGGGWFAFGVDRSLSRSRYALQGEPIDGLCAEEERGILEEGEVEISRQVAVSEAGCPSLVETGSL
jgi:hypothetical protein